MSFPADLQAQLDRLSAAGWSREQIAAATGYTRQRLSAWARGPVEPPHALRVGLEAPMLLTAAFLKATLSLNIPRKVLNISSGLGRRPMASQAVYCAA